MPWCQNALLPVSCARTVDPCLEHVPFDLYWDHFSWHSAEESDKDWQKRKSCFIGLTPAVPRTVRRKQHWLAKTCADSLMLILCQWARWNFANPMVLWKRYAAQQYQQWHIFPTKDSFRTFGCSIASIAPVSRSSHLVHPAFHCPGLRGSRNSWEGWTESARVLQKAVELCWFHTIRLATRCYQCLDFSNFKLTAGLPLKEIHCAN